jgi:hypothetical protein
MAGGKAEALLNFVARALARPRADFLKEFAGTPILLQLNEPDAAKPGTVPTQRFGTIMIRKEDIQASEQKMFVHPLRKAQLNAFAMMITVGRAANNDIVLPYDGISKFHAHFTKAPDGAWTLADAKSTNGTFLEGKRLAAEAKERLDLKRPLEIWFAEAIKCRLYSPDGFYDFAESVKRLGAEGK